MKLARKGAPRRRAGPRSPEFRWAQSRRARQHLGKKPNEGATIPLRERLHEPSHPPKVLGQDLPEPLPALRREANREHPSIRLVGETRD